MRKTTILLLGLGVLAAPLLHGKSDALQMHALLQAKSPMKKLMLSLEILKEDPANRVAHGEILSLLQKGTPAERAGITESLLKFAETHSCPNFLVSRIVSYAMQAGQPRARCAALCRKAIETSAPLTPKTPVQEIRVYLELLGFAAGSPPFALAEDSRRYQKIWDLAPELLWTRTACAGFFLTASRLAPQERRWFGLKQSESANYETLFRACFEHFAKGNEEERFAALEYACRAGDTESALAVMKTLPFGHEVLEEILLRERSGDRAGAIACCRAYLKEHPEPFPQLQRKLATLLFFDGQLPEAEQAAELAYASEPKETAMLLGLIRTAAGRPGGVDAHLTQEEAMQLRILRLTKAGRCEEAVRVGLEYQKAHPESAALVFSALYSPIQQGNCTDAARELLQRMRAGEMLRDPVRANDLGYTLCSLGLEMEEAERLLEYAADQRPLDSPTLDSLAFLRFRQGRLQEARQLIDRALRLAKPDMEPSARAELLGHAADIALALGHREEALQFYRQALASPDLQLAPSLHPEWQKKAEELRSSVR